MITTNIISAIGNNSSIYPLLVRDCCIEVPSKIYITRKENLKESRQKANDATREKFIDEYFTSAVWLGGIPLVEFLANKFIKKKGYNPEFNLKLLKEEEYQGIEYNIRKFKNLAPDAVKELEKIKNNKRVFEKFVAGKFASAVIIPTAIMGFVLPKLNFALTKKIKTDRKNKQMVDFNQGDLSFQKKATIDTFTSSKNINFTGNWISTIANLRTVDKMALTDGGLTVGRVTTSRNKQEGAVNAFRMLGSMFLNFVAPVYIAKFLDKTANKLFNINVNLDPKIMENETFIEAIKNNQVELPKSNSAKDLFEFIDSNPKSLFSQFAQMEGKISYLESGVRNPLKYVDVDALANFKNEFENFVKSAQKSKDINKFVKKAKYVKSLNIISNVLISSSLLAIALPKAQYWFNKLITGSYSDPGLKD